MNTKKNSLRKIKKKSTMPTDTVTSCHQKGEILVMMKSNSNRILKNNYNKQLQFCHHEI